MNQTQPANTLGPPDTILRGRWLVAAWLAWIAIFALALVTFIAVDRFALAEIRETQGNVILLVVTLSWLVVFGAAAAVILWRKHNDWVALLVALALVTFPMITTDSDDGAFLAAHSEWVIPFILRTLFVGPPLLLLLFVFPNGRFIPRWSGVIVPVLWVAVALITGLPMLSDSAANGIFIGNVFWLGIFVFGVFSQVYRYRRVSNLTERQQTKWVIGGLAVLILGVLVWAIGFFALPPLSGAPGPIDVIGGTSFGTFGLPFELGAAVLTFGLPLALPLSFMFAILRYRLWDIDIVVNRALVYGVLTAALVGIYFGGIILIQMAFRAVTGQENAVAVVISTLAIAALFMPLRSRIQDFIDRRFYRRKYDAAQTLAAFSIRMRDEVDLEQLGEQLVAVVKDTMQPAHVSLWLQGSNARRRDTKIQRKQ